MPNNTTIHFEGPHLPEVYLTQTEKYSTFVLVEELVTLCIFFAAFILVCLSRICQCFNVPEISADNKTAKKFLTIRKEMEGEMRLPSEGEQFLTISVVHPQENCGQVRSSLPF